MNSERNSAASGIADPVESSEETSQWLIHELQATDLWPDQTVIIRSGGFGKSAGLLWNWCNNYAKEQNQMGPWFFFFNSYSEIWTLLQGITRLLPPIATADRHGSVGTGRGLVFTGSSQKVRTGRGTEWSEPSKHNLHTHLQLSE